MNFLDLLNQVARFAKPINQAFSPIEKLETNFVDTDIDSLDGLMVVMYISLIYGIDDNHCKDFSPKSPKELLEFVDKFKTCEPSAIQEAMEIIK